MRVSFSLRQNLHPTWGASHPVGWEEPRSPSVSMHLLFPCLSLSLGVSYCFPRGVSRLLPISASSVLQASELGMTSAFYKYILTTMVRTPLQPPPTSAPGGPAPASCPLLGPRTSPSCTWTGSWRTPPTSWASPCSTPRTPSIPSSCAASTCPGGRTVKPAPTPALR